MTIGSAIILGLVQGIAEFLPISSSGHLSVLQNLFDMSTAENGHMFFDVLLHLGTLASICICYWKDIVEMAKEVFGALGSIRLRAPAGGVAQKNGRTDRNIPAARLFFMIVIATLPLVLILPVNSEVGQLYYHTTFIGVMFLLTGAMLFVSDRMAKGRKTEKNMTVFDALIIGLCQCVATIPGLSRSGTTITAGVAVGLDRSFAVKFSFLLSLPAVLGANILSLVDAVQEGIQWSLVPAYLIGMLTAMVSGIFAIWLMKLISKKSKFGYFSYYCLGVGALTIILSLVF